MAEYLGCQATMLQELALCRRPQMHPKHFERDIEQLVQRFGVRRDSLLTVLSEYLSDQEAREELAVS